MIKPKDTIFHQTITKPKFKDRLKVLFGAEIIIDSEIAITEEVDVLYSKAVDVYQFKRKANYDE